MVNHNLSPDLTCENCRNNVGTEKLESAQFCCIFQVLHFHILVSLAQSLIYHVGESKADFLACKYGQFLPGLEPSRFLRRGPGSSASP